MKSQSAPLQDPLVKQLLDKCVIFSKNHPHSGDAYLHWDEYRLILDQGLATSVIDSWRDRLRTYEYICPVGKSGLTLGVLAARKLRMPMIWIDKDGRVIPQSRGLRDKKIAVIDSHSYMGAHFSLAYSRLIARKVKQVGFFAVAIRDLEDRSDNTSRLVLPSDPITLVSAKREFVLFKSRFEVCRGEALSDELCHTILASADFWGKRD